MDVDELLLAASKTQEAQKRLQICSDLISYLDGKGKLDSRQSVALIDTLNEMLRSSNFKVCLAALEVFSLYVFKIKDGFSKYFNTVIPTLIETLKNSNEQVREQVQNLLGTLVDNTASPQAILDRLTPSFHHKAWRIRDEILLFIFNILEAYQESLSLSKLLPQVCSLLSDANLQVRDTAFKLLMEMYRLVGDRIRQDIEKKKLIPSTRVAPVLLKFDELKRDGLVKDSSSKSAKSSGGGGSNLPSTLSKVNGARKTSAVTRPVQSASTTASAGAMNSDAFIKHFADVPKVTIYSGKSLAEELLKIKSILDDEKVEWNQRVAALKKMRSYINADASEYPEFMATVKEMERTFCTGIKDLRSQVCREACITISHLAMTLTSGMSGMLEQLIPALFSVVPNSAKVMATSAKTCLQFIVEFVHSPRVFSSMQPFQSSKAVTSRRQYIFLVGYALLNWDSSLLEKNIKFIEDSINKCITDADDETRTNARRAFSDYKEMFPNQAEALLSQFDAKIQRRLKGELSKSSSMRSLTGSLTASQESISCYTDSGTSSKSRFASKSLTRKNSLSISQKNSFTPVSGLSRSSSENYLAGNPSLNVVPVSTSTGYNPNSRRRSAPRIGVSSLSARESPSPVTVPKRNSNSDVKPSPRVTQSQRARSLSVSGSRSSSRASSPSSKMQIKTSSSRRSNLPRSVGGSREHSPSSIISGRTPTKHLSLTQSQATARFAKPYQSTKFKILTKSNETENAIADALKRTPKRRYDSYQYSDDDSDVSSICSYGSVGTSGYVDIENISVIFEKLASQNWADRKEGLLAMQNFINNEISISASEIKRATEIFSRMFMDSHPKVLTLFLDVLKDFVAVYRDYLYEWLNLLLSKLLQKTGAENLLNSGLNRVQSCLLVVHESFAFDSQFAVLLRYVSDHTQTKSTKVKISVLTFLIDVIYKLHCQNFVNSSETRQAIQIVISWAQDKNSEVRKLATNVITSLYDLNAAEFTTLQAVLPKSCQDTLNSILMTYVQRASEDLESSFSISSTATPLRSSTRGRRSSNSSRKSSQSSTGGLNSNTNSEVRDSLRKTTAEIQHYYGRGTPNPDSHHQLEEEYDSGLPNSITDLNEEHEYKQYNPSNYQQVDSPGGRDCRKHEGNEEEFIVQLFRVLSHHNAKVEQRENALISLTWLVKRNELSIWEVHFKTCLLMLFETLGDNEKTIRTSVLAVLRELLRFHRQRFKDYAELTIMKVLEAHKDPDESVVKSAAALSRSIVETIPYKQCLSVLCPIIRAGEFPVNQAAIKMVTQIVESLSEEEMQPLRDLVIPVLLEGFQHSESVVRKDSVFGLVAVSKKIGSDLNNYTSGLSSGKKKLVDLYIKRAETPLK